ncbi:hypothetical protein FRC12_014179 [Ceratobasidium sp. 428]|nr:hypothetical protein FRC12_014179 [Ceratobasidium sp. 428]
MPPQRFVRPSSARSTPLPKGHYGIASALPPTFGVHELFDWSPKDSASVSTRSVSAGFSTFQRHWQKAKPSSSVSAWVRDQKTNSLPREDISPDRLSSVTGLVLEPPLFTSTPTSERALFSSASITGRPLFAPTVPSSWSGSGSTRSPTPTKGKSAQLPSQLPTAETRLKPSPKYYSPSRLLDPNIPLHASPESFSSANTLNLVSPSITAPTASSASSSRRTASEHNQQRAASTDGYKGWGFEGYGASDDINTDAETSGREDMSELIIKQSETDDRSEDESSAGPDSEDESDEESEFESEVSGNIRTRASRYIDFEAREAREIKSSKARAQKDTNSLGDRWLGGSQGLMSFRKRPNGTEAIIPGKWSFSNDGAARQPLKDREAGDIHFSPGYSGGSGDDYWVVVDYPKRRWVSCAEGQAHPTLAGYVLRPRAGTKPPQWVRTQSLRAGKWRGRLSS